MVIKRLVTSTAVVLLLTGLLAWTTASPAQAHTEVCAGQGIMDVGSPLYSIGFGPAKNTTYTLSLGIGHCSSGGILRFSGTMSGPVGGAHCELWSAFGVINDHPYSATAAGSVFVTSGEAVGVFVFTPATGQSCFTGATRFLVSGAVVFLPAVQ